MASLPSTTLWTLRPVATKTPSWTDSPLSVTGSSAPIATRHALRIVKASLAVAVFSTTAAAWSTPDTGKSRQVTASAGGLQRQLTLSPYERDILSSVLANRDLKIEDHPEGKSIDGIEIETMEVFGAADPIPDWVNWFHTTSRKPTIEREVLLRSGQPYDQGLVEESARNLRTLNQVSLVIIVPVQSEQSDHVRLLVITKDVWSLRLNSSFRVRNGTFEYLALQPSETNLAGTHLSLAGQYIYDLSTNTFGGTVSHQRLFGSRIRATLKINAIQYRKTGVFEGSYGALAFGQPLYSTQTKWAWGTSMAWLNEVNRPLRPDPSGTYVPRTYRDPSALELGSIPYRYHARALTWQTFVTRSYGSRQKSNLSFGAEALQRNVDANLLVREGYSEDLVRRFEQNALERKDVRIGPFLMLETYRNDFISLFDLETLGLQEDYQLGPRAFVKVYGGSKRALATRDVVGVTTALQYSASLRGSLLRFWTSHSTELTPQARNDDGLIQGGLRLVSPSVGFGRFVFDTGGLFHYHNSRNLRFALGGDRRLRGYPSEQFLGHHLAVSNLEFRTRSVRLIDVLFGLVGFYDVGDAFDATSQLRPKHAIGCGIRATAPQFQRVVGRLDLAFPLTRPLASMGESWSSVTWFLAIEGQAFPFPTVQSSPSRTPLLGTASD